MKVNLDDRLYAKSTSDHSYQVNTAFVLGLLWGKCPQWFWENLEHCWDYQEPKASLRFSFISDISTSWHDAYRELRKLGWTRYYANREGGIITYGLEHINSSRPEGWQSIRVAFIISLRTCRQVKTGTKEVDIFETVCDDVQEPSETELEYDDEGITT